MIDKMPTGTLRDGEPHPAAFEAKSWLAGYILRCGISNVLRLLEAFASTGLSGNRLAECCGETLRRAIHGQPVSDRYLLGLVWTLKSMEEPLDLAASAEKAAEILTNFKTEGEATVKAVLDTARVPYTEQMPATADISDNDPIGDAYANGYANGYEAKALAVERQAAAKDQTVQCAGLDPLILAAQEALDVLDLLKLGRSIDGRVSNAAYVLRQEMQVYLKGKLKREYVNADDRKEAAKILADFFVSKLASYETPHNATVYAEWALTSLLQRFEIRRRG